MASGTEYRVLTYHRIGAAPSGRCRHRGLNVKAGAFARQLRLLKALGWQGLSMGALEPYLRGERSGKVFGITLDDGYVETATEALPVLTALGFSATCFVVSGRIGATNDWDAGEGVPSWRLMDEAGLRQWQAGGQEVGAHTRTHRPLDTLGMEEAFEEIAGSRRDLEGLLQQEVRHFAYPYGRFGEATPALVARAGLRTAVTTARGAIPVSTAPLLELPRIGVHHRSHPLSVWWTLQTVPVREPRQVRLPLRIATG